VVVVVYVWDVVEPAIYNVEMAQVNLERMKMESLVLVVFHLALVIAAVLLVFIYVRELARDIAKDALKNVEMLAV
jgi:hypothetical protein